MVRRYLPLLFVLAVSAWAQKYSGARPPKPDMPYLVHADNLVPTEVGEAKEQSRKDDILYVIPGASSTARTPLASPLFLFQSKNIAVEKLQLYKLEVKDGQRQVLFSHKKKVTARPIRIEVNRVSSDNLYRIEVDESLEPGEYSLTPDGTNEVFCFQVF